LHPVWIYKRCGGGHLSGSPFLNPNAFLILVYNFTFAGGSETPSPKPSSGIVIDFLFSGGAAILRRINAAPVDDARFISLVVICCCGGCDCIVEDGEIETAGEGGTAVGWHVPQPLLRGVGKRTGGNGVDTLRERVNCWVGKLVVEGGAIILGQFLGVAEMIPSCWRDIHIADTVINVRVR
jgi:hypothetical protein